MLDELALIVLVSVAAHVSIAWSAIAYHTRRAERKWEKKISDEMIPKAAQTAASSVTRVWKDPEFVKGVVDTMIDQIPSDVPQGFVEKIPDHVLALKLSSMTDRVAASVQGVLNERLSHAKDAIVGGAEIVRTGNVSGAAQMLGIRKRDLSTLGGWLQLLLSNPMGISVVDQLAQPLGFRLIRIEGAQAEGGFLSNIQFGLSVAEKLGL